MQTKKTISIGSDDVLCPKEYLDVFFPEMPDGTFRALCLNNGFTGTLCKNNNHSLCCMVLFDRPRDFYHYWDGKNAWKCPCG
jgi:hypothetical protein